MYGKRSDQSKLAKLLDRDKPKNNSNLDQTDGMIGGVGGIFAKIKKTADEGEFGNTKERDRIKDKRIFIGLIISTIIVALFCFIFIIVMGVRFSNHSGYLWLVTILDVLFFGHLCIEIGILFITGILVHKKLWEREDIY